jgi:hypothetical protein
VSQRFAIGLAWSLFGFFMLTFAATCALVLHGGGTSDDVVVVLASGYAAAGALVASREPANAIGWLMLAIAVGFGLSNLTYAYARDPDPPGVVAVAWFASWSFYVPIYLATMLLPLLFPTGRLLSPRWRLAPAVMIAALALSIVGASLAEGSLDVEAPAPIANPLGLGGALGNVVTALSVSGGFLALSGIVLGAVALVVRLRGSRGRERQQLKMLTYVVVVLLVDILVFVVGGTLSDPALSWVGNFGWVIGTLLISLGVPLAIGIAILRHRLYDIDVVINRTLVYGVLTVTLAGLYLGLFFILERLVLRPVTSDSDLAVAASTLAVAALSRPARTRIQTAVDRRFYRQRYDARRTLDRFAVRLRDELDLEAVAADLQRITQETFQPIHVSLWQREDAR